MWLATALQRATPFNRCLPLLFFALAHVAYMSGFRSTRSSNSGSLREREPPTAASHSVRTGLVEPVTRPISNGLHSIWVFVLVAADCIRVACPVSTKLGDLKALVSQVSSVHICGFEDERGALPEVWIAARTCTIKAILQCVDEPCICDYKYALEACDRPATHDVHSIPAAMSHRAGGDHDPQDGVFWFSVFVRILDDARHCVQIHGGMKIDTLLQIVPFDLMPGDEPGFFHGCRAMCGDRTFGESRVAPHDLLQIRLKRAARGVRWSPCPKQAVLIPVWLWSDGLCVCEDQVDGDATAPQIALSMRLRTRLHCDIFFEGAEIPNVPIRQLRNDFGVVHFDTVVKHADGRLAADLMQPARWQLGQIAGRAYLCYAGKTILARLDHHAALLDARASMGSRTKTLNVVACFGTHDFAP